MLLSLLTEPLNSAFGWKRSEISYASMIFVVTAVTLSLPLGALMDRHGVRSILLPSLVAFGSILGSMYFLSPNVTHLYLAYFALGVAAAAILPNSYSRVIVGWFDKKRGQALAIAATGTALGMVILPPVLTTIIVTQGWQAVYLACAALVLLICFPSVAFLLRENPSIAKRVDNVALKGASSEEFRSATRSYAFWGMAIGFSCLGFGTAGVIPHIVPMLQDMQASDMTAAFALSLYGMGAVVGRLTCGYFLDRFPSPNVAVAVGLNPLVACLLLIVYPHEDTILFAAVLIGIGAGAELDLMPFMISRYLSLRVFSQIYAVLFAGFFIAGAIGTAALGFWFDRSGSYTAGLTLLVGASALAILVLFQAKRYPLSASS
ncbi:MAG: MFS transporter [Gammaproteobacteria bacterium]|nr:MFS transporter [Gammaproteobacteria bacterium]